MNKMKRKVKTGIAGALIVLGALTSVDGLNKVMKAESKYAEQRRDYTTDNDIQRTEYLIKNLSTLTSSPSRYDAANKSRNCLHSEWDGLLNRGALGKRDKYVQVEKEHLWQVGWGVAEMLVPLYLGGVVSYAGFRKHEQEKRRRE